MSRARRRFTPEQKAQIVCRHVAGKEPVSALAEEFGLQPSQMHGWVNQVLAQADKAFERSADNGRSEKAHERRIEQLEAKLENKNEGHRPKGGPPSSWRRTSRQKKSLGNSERTLGSSPRHAGPGRGLRPLLDRMTCFTFFGQFECLFWTAQGELSDVESEG